MKQRHGIHKISQVDRLDRFSRLAGFLPWFLGVLLVAAIAVLILVDELGTALTIVLGLVVTVLMIILLMMLQTSRRRQRSWRSEDIVFEPQLSSPVSSIYEEREWNWPSHPLIRYPLALGLIVFVYWVLVLNQMKMPGHWLVSLVLMTLVSLWCWREPLLLVLIVILGVGLLALIGWVITNLSVGAMLGLLALIAVSLVMGMKELNKHNIKR